MTREEAIEVYHGLINTKIKEAFEFFAPELRESEDERIRKRLITLIRVLDSSFFTGNNPSKEQCLAYLEKQKEQNPKEVDESTKRLNDNWMKQHFDDYEEQKPAEWSDEDRKILDNLIWDVHMKSISPSDEMDDSCRYEEYEKFLMSLPERFNLQPKQEWSEEDENRFRNLIFLVQNSKEGDATKEGFIKFINRLKSLRPSWKPGEEELVALKRVGSILRDYGHSELAKTVFMIEGKLANLSVINKSIWKPSKEQMKALLNAEGLVRANNYPENAKILAKLYEQLKAL